MIHADTELGDGLQISVRPLRNGDEQTIAAVFDGMSDDSRYLRYLRPMPRLNSTMRRILADIDGVHHRAAAAWDGTRPVGIVRLVNAGCTTELAVELIDDVRGRGLGRLLVGAAIEAAAADGIEELTVLVHVENRRAVHLFRQFGFSFQRDGSELGGMLAPTAMGSAA